MEKEFAQQMTRYANEIGIQLEEEQLKQLYQYMKRLLEWNKKMNLTAITKEEEIILKHFIDSFTIAKYLKKDKKIVDVGTGAGFPGIPLKIIRPDLEILLLDSLNKRILFLEEVIKELKLTKINTIHSRAEEFGRNKRYRESFSYATSRAVANLSTLAEYLLPLIEIGGYGIAMKGSEIEEEVKKSKKAISVLGGKIEKIDSFLLPKSEIKRNIILIKKEKKTSLQYPRKAGTPGKEPII